MLKVLNSQSRWLLFIQFHFTGKEKREQTNHNKTGIEEKNCRVCREQPIIADLSQETHLNQIWLVTVS